MPLPPSKCNDSIFSYEKKTFFFLAFCFICASMEFKTERQFINKPCSSSKILAVFLLIVNNIPYSRAAVSYSDAAHA